MITERHNTSGDPAIRDLRDLSKLRRQLGHFMEDDECGDYSDDGGALPSGLLRERLLKARLSCDCNADCNSSSRIVDSSLQKRNHDSRNTLPPFHNYIQSNQRVYEEKCRSLLARVQEIKQGKDGALGDASGVGMGTQVLSVRGGYTHLLRF